MATKRLKQPLVKEVILEAQPVKYVSTPSVVGTNLDFTLAAQKTVNAVVHVKTESTVNPNYANPWMDFFGMESGPQVQKGSGSGVIISSDGYIVTNNM